MIIDWRVRARWLSNNYGKLSVVTPRDGESFSRGKDAKTEKTWKNKKVEEVKEGWNGNGRGTRSKGGSHYGGSKPSGDASVTELTLPCAFVRKRGLASPRFPPIYVCICICIYIHIYICLLSSLFYLSSAHKAAHFYPRGCLVDLSFLLPRYGPENKPVAVIRALPCRSLFPFFLLHSPELQRIQPPRGTSVRRHFVKLRVILMLSCGG